MTDKVQKIREEIEKLRIKNTEAFDCGCDGTKCAGYDMACDDIISLIDSMQEEPVSIWHNSNEEQPNFASTVAIWNPKDKNGEILSRCTEVYPDRIWAYIDDLLKM